MSVIYKPAGRAGEYSEWAVNLYGGCTHGCKYCYVPAVRRMKPEAFYATDTPYRDVLKKLKADCIKLRGTIATPIMFSFTSDAYQPSEATHRVTRAAIGMLKCYGFRVCILTKGGMRATADFDLLDARDIMAASLTCIEDADSLKWEPNAALPSDRFALLRAAKAHGMETWASLEPVIYPDQTLRIIDATRGIVDLYKIGTINYVKAVSDKIDWPAFVTAAMAAVRANGAAYYIKGDLLKFAPAGTAAHWNPHGKAMMHA